MVTKSRNSKLVSRHKPRHIESRKRFRPGLPHLPRRGKEDVYDFKYPHCGLFLRTACNAIHEKLTADVRSREGKLPHPEYVVLKTK
jgi:hypothetical protein